MTPHPLTAAAARRRVITGGCLADVQAEVARDFANQNVTRIHIGRTGDQWEAIIDIIEGAAE